MTLYNIQQLTQIFSPHITQKLPVSVSYKIYKLMRALEEEQKFFEERRQEIINQYGEHDENGQLKISEQGFVQIPEAVRLEAQEKLNELADIDVELPNIAFTIEELEGINLSVQDIAILEPLLKEG